jgi:glycosyltransferase involved in cell wall biosynthesis
MRIALVSYTFAEYCIQQANGLVRECDVLLMLPPEDAGEYVSQLDPAVHYRPFDKPRLRQPVRQLTSVASILRQVHRFRPDVIHFQHGHMWFNLALPALRSYPLVVTVHDPRHHVGDAVSRKTPQALMDFGFRRADQIIVHGEVLKQQVIQQLGIKSERIHVIPHVALGCTGGRQPQHEDAKQVLFFGRIWKYKGLEYLIRAQPLVTAAVPDAQFVIAGEGDDFEPYRRLMSQPDRFIVHNRYLTGLERDELFHSASLVVLPYIEATQSGVVPLAYAFGKPVVATNTGALSEAVEDGVTGRLVPPANSAALAASIVDLLQNPAQRQAMGSAGRHKLDSEWSPPVVARQTMAVYRRAIQDRAQQRISVIGSKLSASHSGHRTIEQLYPTPDT